MSVNKLSQTLGAYNSRILRSKNAKFSGYYFCMNTNILGDFQICISVPLKLHSRELKNLKQFFINVTDKNPLIALTHTHGKDSSIFFAEIILWVEMAPMLLVFFSISTDVLHI